MCVSILYKTDLKMVSETHLICQEIVFTQNFFQFSLFSIIVRTVILNTHLYTSNFLLPMHIPQTEVTRHHAKRKNLEV